MEDTLVTSSHVSDLHFASGVVANMGAPLRTGPAFSEGADLSVSISSLDELSSIAGSRFAQTDGDEWDAFYEVPRVVKEPLKDGLGLLNDEIVLQPLERDPEVRRSADIAFSGKLRVIIATPGAYSVMDYITNSHAIQMHISYYLAEMIVVECL